jgi:hypothetical protein
MKKPDFSFLRSPECRDWHGLLPTIDIPNRAQHLGDEDFISPNTKEAFMVLAGEVFRYRRYMVRPQLADIILQDIGHPKEPRLFHKLPEEHSAPLIKQREELLRLHAAIVAPETPSSFTYPEWAYWQAEYSFWKLASATLAYYAQGCQRPFPMVLDASPYWREDESRGVLAGLFSGLFSSPAHDDLADYAWRLKKWHLYADLFLYAGSVPRLLPDSTAAANEWWEANVRFTRECSSRWIEPRLPDQPSAWTSAFDRRQFPPSTSVIGEPAYLAEHCFIGACRHFDRPTEEDRPRGGPLAQSYLRPFRLSETALKEHCYMVGPTGSGKTSLGIMPLLMQLIRGNRQPDGSWTDASPMVILDLKGDYALFHTVREEALNRAHGKQEFLFFTTERNAPSYRFNPFRGFSPELRSLPQYCQMLLDALSLNHGKGYGRGYFTERSRATLSAALEENPNVRTFRELHDTLRNVARKSRDKRDVTDAFELFSIIETLTHYPQLVTSPEDDLSHRDSMIYVPDVIEKRQIAYFWLPAQLESISVGEIAKLVIFNLRAASQDRRRLKPNEPRRIVLLIDEFQHVAGENLRGVLQDARSFGISAILVNQSLEDLKTPSGFNLAPTVITNTCAKFFFTHPTRGRYYAFIDRETGLTPARQYPERGDPRLRDGAAAQSGLEVITSWPLPKAVYDRRDRSSLPSWNDIPGGNWYERPAAAAGGAASSGSTRTSAKQKPNIPHPPPEPEQERKQGKQQEQQASTNGTETEWIYDEERRQQVAIIKALLAQP